MCFLPRPEVLRFFYGFVTLFVGLNWTPLLTQRCKSERGIRVLSIAYLLDQKKLTRGQYAGAT